MTLPITTPPDGSGNPPATTPGAGDANPNYEIMYKQALSERQEYYNRWTGLQGKYNQEQQKWTSDAEKLRTYETQLQEALGQKVTMETQLKALQETSSSTVGELESLRKATERLNVVVKEFPTLIPFLAVQQGDKVHDLLPQGSGDDLRTLLNAFAASIQAQITGNPPVKPPVSGATPPAPAPSTTPGPADLKKQMAEAIQRGDMVAYNKIYDELLNTPAAK